MKTNTRIALDVVDQIRDLLNELHGVDWRPKIANRYLYEFIDKAPNLLSRSADLLDDLATQLEDCRDGRDRLQRKVDGD